MEERKSKRSPVTRKKFLEISKHVKEGLRLGLYDAKDVADQYGVSAETIRAVRRAGTWPQWVRNKQEVQRRRGRGPSDIPPVAPSERVVTFTLNQEDYENILHRLDRLEKHVSEIQKAPRGLFGRKPKVRQW
jgi:hypothetical protein